MVIIVIKFSTLLVCSTISCLAIANNNTSIIELTVCLDSILKNSIAITILKACEINIPNDSALFLCNINTYSSSINETIDIDMPITIIIAMIISKILVRLLIILIIFFIIIPPNIF